MPKNPNEYYVRVLRSVTDNTARNILEHNMSHPMQQRIIRETYKNTTLLFCNELETLNQFRP